MALTISGVTNVVGTVGTIADRVVRVAEAVSGSPTVATPAPALPAPKVGLAAMLDGAFLGVPFKWWAIGLPLSAVIYFATRGGKGG